MTYAVKAYPLQVYRPKRPRRPASLAIPQWGTSLYLWTGAYVTNPDAIGLTQAVYSAYSSSRSTGIPVPGDSIPSAPWPSLVSYADALGPVVPVPLSPRNPPGQQGPRHCKESPRHPSDGSYATPAGAPDTSPTPAYPPLWAQRRIHRRHQPAPPQDLNPEPHPHRTSAHHGPNTDPTLQPSAKTPQNWPTREQPVG